MKVEQDVKNAIGELLQEANEAYKDKPIGENDMYQLGWQNAVDHISRELFGAYGLLRYDTKFRIKPPKDS